jgi:hypothetical protein
MLAERKVQNILERRARMLLQSAGGLILCCLTSLLIRDIGFLDIDKLIEHRPPPDDSCNIQTSPQCKYY